MFIFDLSNNNNMNTITQNIWSDEAIASKMENFDFDLLFNNSTKIVYTQPKTNIIARKVNNNQSQVLKQLDWLRQLRNDFAIIDIEKREKRNK